MEVTTGYFFQTVYFSFATGIIGTFVLMQIVQFLGFGKKSPSSGNTYKENKTPEQRIAEAKSFDELERVVYDIGPIQGSNQTYYPPEMAARLEAVDAYVTGKTVASPPTDPDSRKRWLKRYHATEEGVKHMESVHNYFQKLSEDPELRRWPTSLITHTYGLREKAEELLNKQEGNLHELKKK
jgi:hypothetical protein